LQNGLPLHTSLNVNIPDLPYNQQKGIKICRAAQAHWSDSFEKRIDPHGTPYWWLTGKFICNDTNTNTDEYALHQGYVSVVPIHPDYTDYDAMPIIQQQLQ
ncbi:MAG: 5'/3'-nucleotidase SurE, partial [Bacteroidales bacterium]|nr:5'/3'-nucleotidase SurE [Candidatus Colimorpha onthohippi]